MLRRSVLAAALAVALVGAPLGLIEAQAAAPSRGEILWDRYGVPHVYGTDEASVFYGFGYAQARNHGDVVIRLYGEARGRAAEYWGEKDLESDKWMLANDVPERALAWYKQQTPQFRRNLDAFAQGINDYAAANPGKINPEVAKVLPVSGVDVMAHAHRLMNYIYIAPQAATMGTGGAM
jgi:acyl-homoserine-lactone acylase